MDSKRVTVKRKGHRYLSELSGHIALVIWPGVSLW